MFRLAVYPLLLFLPRRVLSQYQLVQEYNTRNFFDEFSFFTGQDPTNGFVQYVSYETAATSGLIGNSSGSIYVGVDHTNIYQAGGPGRPSVRLESKSSFTEGLFVLDLSHMPSGCGIWPAFWTVGLGDWPADGEIDIIENVNDATENSVALHAAGDCTVSDTTEQTGTRLSTDCDIFHDGNQGCATKLTEPYSFGTAFNQNRGGVYAMEWTSTTIKVWFFPPTAIPESLSPNSSSNPDPSTFGTPSASFGGPCSSSFGNQFFNHTIILDTTFCGGWAGKTYGIEDSRCPNLAGASPLDSCIDYVANYPLAFTEAFWTINSLRVWQKVPSLFEVVDPFFNQSTNVSVAAAAVDVPWPVLLEEAPYGNKSTNTSALVDTANTIDIEVSPLTGGVLTSDEMEADPVTVQPGIGDDKPLEPLPGSDSPGVWNTEGQMDEFPPELSLPAPNSLGDGSAGSTEGVTPPAEVLNGTVVEASEGIINGAVDDAVSVEESPVLDTDDTVTTGENVTGDIGDTGTTQEALTIDAGNANPTEAPVVNTIDDTDVTPGSLTGEAGDSLADDTEINNATAPATSTNTGIGLSQAVDVLLGALNNDQKAQLLSLIASFGLGTISTDTPNLPPTAGVSEALSGADITPEFETTEEPPAASTDAADETPQQIPSSDRSDSQLNTGRQSCSPSLRVGSAAWVRQFLHDYFQFAEIYETLSDKKKTMFKELVAAFAASKQEPSYQKRNVVAGRVQQAGAAIIDGVKQQGTWNINGPRYGSSIQTPAASQISRWEALFISLDAEGARRLRRFLRLFEYVRGTNPDPDVSYETYLHYVDGWREDLGYFNEATRTEILDLLALRVPYPRALLGRPVQDDIPPVTTPSTAELPLTNATDAPSVATGDATILIAGQENGAVPNVDKAAKLYEFLQLWVNLDTATKNAILAFLKPGARRLAARQLVVPEGLEDLLPLAEYLAFWDEGDGDANQREKTELHKRAQPCSCEDDVPKEILPPSDLTGDTAPAIEDLAASSEPLVKAPGDGENTFDGSISSNPYGIETGDSFDWCDERASLVARTPKNVADKALDMRCRKGRDRYLDIFNNYPTDSGDRFLDAFTNSPAETT